MQRQISIENLRKIGIKMTFRNLETNIFKNRLDKFDFEVVGHRKNFYSNPTEDALIMTKTYGGIFS